MPPQCPPSPATRGFPREGSYEHRTHGHRWTSRPAAAVPEGHRQGRSVDGGTGGGAGEANRARRSSREATDGGGEPPSGGVDREEVPRPGLAASGPDPGGDDRVGTGGGEVRPPPGIQVLDLRDLVDPASGGTGVNEQGEDDPHAGARGREAEQDHPLGAK